MLATRWHIVVSENLIVSFKLFCCFLLALLLVLTFHWPPFLCSVSHDHYLMFTNPNTHGPGRANLPKIFLVIISICLVASPRAIMTSLSSVLEEGWCAGEQGLTVPGLSEAFLSRPWQRQIKIGFAAQILKMEHIFHGRRIISIIRGDIISDGEF